MIQIQRHIEVLLLENECVIVPDFGGFMTHEVPARYDQDDHLFLPPYRTLGFNPQLRMNDSILAQSYVEAYDISYPEALRRIELEVEELKRVLSEEGRYDLEDLGTLTVNQEGNYEFTPCEAGVLSPALYGLGDFNFKPLKDQTVLLPVAQPKAEEIPLPATSEVASEHTLLDFTEDENNGEEKTITIKMSWIRNAVAVAAAAVAFFLIATPITNSDLGTQTMSQMQHNLLYKLIPQDTNIVPVDVEAEKVEAVAPEAETVAEKIVAEKIVAEKSPVAETKPVISEEKPVVKETPVKQHYVIVVASQVKRSNAEIYIQQLQKQGYQDARMLDNEKFIRVVCGRFDTEAEAYHQLNRMNVKEEFYEAWVLKVKEHETR